MKIFVLEDSPERLKRLQQLLIGHEVTYAASVEEALREWAPPYPLLLLDHDLGGEPLVDSGNANTGYQFLKSVIGGVEGSVVVIHSFNPSGAANMHALVMGEGKVAAAVLAPFGPALAGVLEQLLPKGGDGEEDSHRGVHESTAGTGAG